MLTSRVFHSAFIFVLVFDYLDTSSLIKGVKEGEVDFANFGFETSIETLSNRA